MQVRFQRTDRRGGYSVLLRRNDGATVRIPGHDRRWRVPHEVAHFATEREFGVDYGVFGSIAAGALFSSMTIASGRPRSDLDARSRAVIRAHAAELGIAEAVSGVVHDGVEQHASAPAIYARLVETWDSMRPDTCPYPPTTLNRCLGVLALLEARWRGVAVGQHLAVVWEPTVSRHRPTAA